MDTTICLACVLYLLYVWHLFYPVGLLSFCFFKNVSKIDSDLKDCFQKLEVILESLKWQEEAKKKFL